MSNITFGHDRGARHLDRTVVAGGIALFVALALVTMPLALSFIAGGSIPMLLLSAYILPAVPPALVIVGAAASLGAVCLARSQ